MRVCGVGGHLGGAAVPQLLADLLLHVHVGGQEQNNNKENNKKKLQQKESGEEESVEWSAIPQRPSFLPPPPTTSRRQLALHVRSRPTSGPKPRLHLINIQYMQALSSTIGPNVGPLARIRSPKRYDATMTRVIG